MAAITQIKIHPAIGLARLGNHPTSTFDGPQKRFDTNLPSGGYKASGKVKRQAAVFRLFGYDANGNVVKEITSAEADIEWSVTLANKKASYFNFAGSSQSTLRNANTPADKRHLLNIVPTPRTVNTSAKNAKFDDGSFSAWNENGVKKTINNISLGELKMDSSGFLRILAAPGKSQSAYPRQITNYANNDGWQDDVADGPVHATVKLHSGNTIFEAVPSWVICAPACFAPGIRNVITMYDVLRDRSLGGTFADTPSFAFDIYPLLVASRDVKWVHKISGHFSMDALLDKNSALNARQNLVNRLRRPTGSSQSFQTMPKLLDDDGDVGLALTKTQFEILEKWSNGDVKTGGVHGTVPPQPTADITPDGMDIAALEGCAGGAFYPGIECGWLMRDRYEFFVDDPFRLKPMQSDPSHPVLKAGDVTKQMALPWQADFLLCRKEDRASGPATNWYGWWPAVRPDDVFFGTSTSAPQENWSTGADGSYEEMVEKWNELRFVVPHGDRFVVK